MNPCDFVIFLSPFLSIQQHPSVHFHFCKNGSTNSDFTKESYTECLLTGLPIALPASFCPCALPWILNTAARVIPSRSLRACLSPAESLQSEET